MCVGQTAVVSTNNERYEIAQKDGLQVQEVWQETHCNNGRYHMDMYKMQFQKQVKTNSAVP